MRIRSAPLRRRSMAVVGICPSNITHRRIFLELCVFLCIPLRCAARNIRNCKVLFCSFLRFFSFSFSTSANQQRKIFARTNASMISPIWRIDSPIKNQKFLSILSPSFQIMLDSIALVVPITKPKENGKTHSMLPGIVFFIKMFPNATKTKNAI